MPFLTDQVAREIALTRWAVPECLHVPIAAVDEAAIAAYIGGIEQILTGGAHRKAFLVKAKEPPPIDARLCVIDGQGKIVWQGRCLSTPEGIAGTVKSKAPHVERIGLESGRDEQRQARQEPCSRPSERIALLTLGPSPSDRVVCAREGA